MCGKAMLYEKRKNILQHLPGDTLLSRYTSPSNVLGYQIIAS
jgi:hypothetical protein